MIYEGYRIIDHDFGGIDRPCHRGHQEDVRKRQDPVQSPRRPRICPSCRVSLCRVHHPLRCGDYPEDSRLHRGHRAGIVDILDGQL